VLHHAAGRPVDPDDLAVACDRHPDVSERGDDAGGVVAHRHRLRHHAVTVQAQQRAVVGRRDPARAQPTGDPPGDRGQGRRGADRGAVRAHRDERRAGGEGRLALTPITTTRPHGRTSRGQRDGHADGSRSPSASRRAPGTRRRRILHWRRLGRDRRVLTQDALLHLAQRRSGLDAQLVDEPSPDSREVLERSACDPAR
jgi:hypothetical protein